MREISFRVWDPERKEIEWPNEPLESGNLLMQYTGFKDKNDIEIYEDDIISWSHGDIIERERVIFDHFIWWAYGLGLPLDIEVIGNIYENPELLDR